MEVNITLLNKTSTVLFFSNENSTDRTGLFIGLFLLFLLFLLISYLFYSFLSFKRFQTAQIRSHTASPTLNDEKIIFPEQENPLLNDEDIGAVRDNSFSDCGTSLRSSSIRSHPYPYCKRSSSYRLCSQASNYLLTPRLSSQINNNNNTDECYSATVIIEPNDIHLANALSRSISKYYERQRKSKLLKRRIHSLEDLTMDRSQLRVKRPLQPTASLPMRSSLRPTDRHHRPDQKQRSLKRKPTTIYELYKSDRMRISNLLVSDRDDQIK